VFFLLSDGTTEVVLMQVKFLGFWRLFSASFDAVFDRLCTTNSVRL
jgi:hypothetical protein